ncbi:hypothetical protein CONPUDRAFT_160367 [Coniophora puteana RWD-64-598 SS2]|uniref:Uncharacterized protein n=1 Tax=Coniophora puteana (strain RWD-64-598) TaxID=741705 RepID=R7SG97_CONPW|nr:uncharacterized protein CONPUDRAFT_160367 [Coniophora puteana RWD-64-598 SS2]EIW74114.1 hypothetical protein CONPUDRAFT_160367 [Coniophora puteana RWD-64-598 SS2]
MAMDMIVNLYNLSKPATTRVGLRTFPLFYLKNFSPDDGTQLDIGRHLVAYYEKIDSSISAKKIHSPVFSGYATVVVNADQWWSYFLVEKADTLGPNPIPFLAEPVFSGPVVLAVKQSVYRAAPSDIRWSQVLQFFLLLSEVEWPDIDITKAVESGRPLVLWETSIHTSSLLTPLIHQSGPPPSA